MKFFKMAVVVDQHHGFKPFVRSPRCKLQSYSHLEYNTTLEFSKANQTYTFKPSFEFTNIHKSFSTPCLSLSATVDEDFDVNPRIEIIGGHKDPRVRALVVEVAIAIVNPEPISGGLGGAYFLHARNCGIIAVAKPIDEEPLAFNNPKGFAGRMLGQPGMKRSIKVGETGIRELAAYLLDHGGFAGVPPTALVKISHFGFNVNNNNNSESISTPPYKIASLQRFVEHDSDAGDLGPSGFSVTSVHRIGILDVRLLNLDRHAGNMLVKHGHKSYAAGAAELIPIDHGLCLPESLDDPYFEWLHWPQASIPFSESELNYISNLDPFKDTELLKAQIHSIRESSIRVLVICTIFLKRATAAEFCLADIGEMMTRDVNGGEENMSVLENLCVQAKASLSSSSTSSDVDKRNSDQDEEIGMFQYDDNECEKSSSFNDVPQFLQSPSNPPKFLRFLSIRSMSGLHDAVLSPLHEQDDHNDYDSTIISEDGDKDDDNVCDVHRIGTLMKSMSFAVPNYKYDSEGISFGEMSEEEWELFLESFEKLMPEAFQSRKNMGLLKQRLGSSCEF